MKIQYYPCILKRIYEKKMNPALLNGTILNRTIFYFQALYIRVIIGKIM